MRCCEPRTACDAVMKCRRVVMRGCLKRGESSNMRFVDRGRFNAVGGCSQQRGDSANNCDKHPRDIRRPMQGRHQATAQRSSTRQSRRNGDHNKTVGSARDTSEEPCTLRGRQFGELLRSQRRAATVPPLCARGGGDERGTGCL